MAKVSIPPTPVQIARVTDDHAFGSCGGVLIVDWRTGITLEGVRELVVYRNGLAARGQLRGAIHIAEAGISLPSSEARAAAEHGVQEAQRAPACALIVLGSGFGASAVRSIGTAIFALRAGPPTRLFADVPEGATWLLRQIDASVVFARLVDACTAMRRAGPLAGLAGP